MRQARIFLLFRFLSMYLDTFFNDGKQESNSDAIINKRQERIPMDVKKKHPAFNGDLRRERESD